MTRFIKNSPPSASCNRKISLRSFLCIKHKCEWTCERKHAWKECLKLQHTSMAKKENRCSTHTWAVRGTAGDCGPSSGLCPCATHHYRLLHSPASSPRASDTHLYSVSPSIAITCVLKAVITTYTATLPPPPALYFFPPVQSGLWLFVRGGW